MPTQLNPYLGFDGNCEEAVNFYAGVLGAEITMLSRYGESPMPCSDEEKQLIMHARLVFENNVMMFSDMPKHAKQNPEGNITLSLGMDNVADMEAKFNAMAEGGTVTMPLADQFWGARFGMVKDKFGINWMFNCEKK
ncbi:MAG TPA: VOC family protein [Ferruginibacter sp.]|nr:VOC family protein [Ferruginibacter sp.]